MLSRSVLVVTIFACLLVTACGAGDDSQPSGQTGAPQQVTGPIVDIDSESLDEVHSFTVKSGERTYVIRIDPHIDYGFALGHLNEHRLSGDPVRVDLVERNGALYAQSIVDA
jgi:hypothetical protein